MAKNQKYLTVFNNSEKEESDRERLKIRKRQGVGGRGGGKISERVGETGF